MKNKTDNRQSFLEEGKKYFNLGKYSCALKKYLEVLRNSPRYAEALFEAGKTYFALGNHPAAIKYLEGCIKSDVHNEHARMLLAKICLMNGEYSSAIKQLKKINREYPEYREVCFKLVQIFKKMPNYELAIKYLLMASKLKIERGEIRLSLIELYLKAGRHSLARKEFKKISGSISRPNRIFIANKILNESEIAKRKIFLKSKPWGLRVTLGTRCNISCIMCLHKITGSSEWELPKRAVKEIKSYFPYLREIQWQGGEVFLMDCFGDLLEEALAYTNLEQSITTNGLLINEEWARRLTRGNVNVDYSIDGVTKGMYEHIRQGAQFKGLLKSIELLNRYRKINKTSRVNTSMCFVVMRSNYREIDKVVEFARKYEFSTFQFNRVKGLESSENIFLGRDPEIINYIRKRLPSISRKAKEYNISFIDKLFPCEEPAGTEKKYSGFDNKGIKPCDGSARNTPEPNREMNTPEAHCGPGNKEALCYLPWQYLSIDDRGFVYPYCFCENSIGNLNDSSLGKMWNNAKMIKYREKILRNDCENICNPLCSSGVNKKDQLKRQFPDQI
jgi:MoaA/NifB/PqqE/SkfB family radical SAM enzyme